MNTISQLKQAFLTFIDAQFSGQLPGETKPLSRTIDCSLNTDPQKQAFGDLTSNAALILAKKLERKPRDIAQEIVTSFSHTALEKIEIAGPGFLNFFLTEKTFQTITRELETQGTAYFTKLPDKPTYNYSIEFVSANPTGPLHLGHGRGGIIGDVFTRIAHIRGHQATAEFYINDAGSQMEKLGDSFKARCLQKLNIEAQTPEGGYQGEYLVTLADQCIVQHGKKLLEQPNEFFIAYAKDHLLAAIKKTLANYGITFDVWFSEKTLHDSGAIAKALEILNRNGHLYEKDGALWFTSTKFGDDKDRVLKKSSGELTYVAADVAYLENKCERGFTKLVMVLGQDHHSYVTRLKAVMAALGHNPDDLHVILYQLVTLKESGELMRLSKRAGRIVGLQDIIDTVGADVARFFYLNRKADSHLEFDVALALKKTEENPVFYIQYAYVRTLSILEKAANISEIASWSLEDARSIGTAEHTLLKKMASLQEVLESITTTYQTHILAYYVIELAQVFHAYYAANRVINLEDIPTTKARLLIVQTVRNTLATCLHILGVSNPEHM